MTYNELPAGPFIRKAAKEKGLSTLTLARAAGKKIQWGKYMFRRRDIPVRQLQSVSKLIGRDLVWSYCARETQDEMQSLRQMIAEQKTNAAVPREETQLETENRLLAMRVEILEKELKYLNEINSFPFF
jgi:cell division protein FtsB